jgi:hypothetical protein
MNLINYKILNYIERAYIYKKNLKLIFVLILNFYYMFLIIFIINYYFIKKISIFIYI